MTSRFEALVLPHLDAGYSLARWLLRDAHDASDATQDACVRALRSIASLRGEAAKPWFLTIVRHACYDWLERHPRLDEYNPERDQRDDHGCDPLAAVMRADAARAISAALGALPIAYREVIVLRELQELSYAEIAAVAAIPLGTVMSRLARARRLLRRSPLLEAVAPRSSCAGTQ